MLWKIQCGYNIEFLIYKVQWLLIFIYHIYTNIAKNDFRVTQTNGLYVYINDLLLAYIGGVKRLTKNIMKGKQSFKALYECEKDSLAKAKKQIEFTLVYLSASNEF